MVAATSMTAASLSGIFLGSFMCALVVVCHRFNRDPDNIVPAVASCLGDLVTLVMLGFVSTLFVPFIQTLIPFLVGIFVTCSAIACFVLTLKNKHVRPLLKVGWWPLLGAMVISSGTGIVLDMFVSRYEGFALLAIVISGMFLPVSQTFIFKMLHRPSRGRRFYSRLKTIYIFTCSRTSSPPRSSFLFKSIKISGTKSKSYHAYTSRRNHPRWNHIPHDFRYFGLA